MHKRPSRSVTAAVRPATGVSVATAMVVFALAGCGDTATTHDAAIRTVEATTRDLRTSVSAPASLDRTETRTITFARASLARAGSAPADSTGTTTVGGEPATAPAASTSSTTVTADPVVTALTAIGSEVTRGSTLFAVDDEPVVAMTGSVPLWRDLTYGVADGEDVRQLEENLVALGFGDGMAVDGTYTDDTATAVVEWETALGRAAPDVTVAVGDIVFLTADAVVLDHAAAVGDEPDPGAAILVVGSIEQRAVASVDADDAAAWQPDAPVELSWADGTTSTGTVASVGRDVTDGQITLEMAVSDDDARRPSGSALTVTAVAEQRTGVVAVPVAALVDGGTGPAVRIVADSASPETRAVAVGLVADGWAEIVSGLRVGERVAAPG